MFYCLPTLFICLYALYVIGLLTLNSRPIAIKTYALIKVCPTHVFSTQRTSVSLHLETLDSSSALFVVFILKSRITKKQQHKIHKMWYLNRLWKKTLVTGSWNRKAETVVLFNPSLEWAHQATHIFCPSAHSCRGCPNCWQHGFCHYK